AERVGRLPEQLLGVRVVPGGDGRMPEPDERERRAPPGAAAGTQRPHALEQLCGIRDLALGEGEVREARPGVGPAALAAGPLEALERLAEEDAGPRGVGGRAGDICPVEQ